MTFAAVAVLMVVSGILGVCVGVVAVIKNDQHFKE